MIAVIGELLPLASGVALSPFPIIGAILVLRSPGGARAGACYLAGWVAGLVAVLVVAELLGAVLAEPGPTTERRPTLGVVNLALGGVLVLFAWRKFSSQPGGDEEPEAPAWMSSVERMSPLRAFGLAAALAAVNPKNLVLAIAAGFTIGATGLSTRSMALATAAFVALSSVTVIVPVVAAVVAPERMAAPLARAHAWLLRNSATLLAVVLLVIGLTVVGKGVARF